MPPEISSTVENSASPVPASVPVPTPAAVTHSTPNPQEQGLRQSSMAVAATPPPGNGTKMDIVPPYIPHKAKDPRFRDLPEFPSPGAPHDISVKFKEDKSTLIYDFQNSLPAAVRAAVRRHWSQTLVGSDWHQAFILNVVINRASPVVMQRTVAELAHIITPGSARPLLDYFNAQDFDDNADTILGKCGNDFLDKALAKRLDTISAPALINALAKAERLGYDHSDILEQKNERVIGGLPNLPGPLDGQRLPPTAHPHRAAPVPSQSLPSQSQPVPQVLSNYLSCHNCAAKFPGKGTLDLHLASRQCFKPSAQASPKPSQFVCPKCNKAFTTPGGLKYHELNKVCENAGQSSPVPPSTAPVASNASSMQGVTPTTTPHLPSSTQSGHQTVSTPVQKGPLITANPAYSHLSPDVRASLEQELRDAETQYAPRFKQAEANADPTRRKRLLANLHNSFSTKQSTIRKKYGVSLRIRRSRAEIDAQQDRMGMTAPSSEADDTPAKRQRTTNGGYRSPSMTSSTPVPPPQPRLAVADMSSGLGSSNATVATTDPTSGFMSVNRSQPGSTSTQPQPQADNSLSSLQKKGYRVSSHMGPRSPSRVTSDIGFKGEPISLDGSNTSDSESEDSDDEEIPASLP